MASTCCAPGCTEALPEGHVMCWEHWADVPLHEKKEIYHQRARQAQGWPDAEELLAAAVRAAEASVA